MTVNNFNLDLELTIINLIGILIIFQGFLFALFLITNKKGKRNSNLLLAGLVFVFALHFLNMVLMKENGGILNFGPFFGLLYGPLLFEYTKSLVFRNQKLSTKELLHLIPAFMILPLVILKLFINDVVTLPIILHLTIYLIFSFLIIVKYHRILQSIVSSVHRIKLSWLQFIILSMFVVPLLLVIEYYLSQTVFENYRSKTELLIYLFGLFLMTSFIYKGLRQPEIFSGIDEEDLEVEKMINKNRVPEDQVSSQRELAKLKAYMNKQKPYLSHSITLGELAGQLSIQPRVLSATINRNLNQNFFEFINEYRVEEAKNLLQDPNNERNRMNEIMLDAGFNSKSTFNHIFKKQTGLTPSQYKSKLKS